MIEEPTQQPVNIGEMVLHHTSDSRFVGIEPFFEFELPQFHGPLAFLSPTKHVFFMLLAAIIATLMMWTAKRGLIRQRAHQQAPKGFSGFIEDLSLWIRNDIAIPAIGHDGAKFAPFIAALFFFILVMNLLGLLPWGATATGNLAITGGLALLVFVVIEVGGFMKLGFKGYMGTIFPHFEGMHGVGAVALSIFMAPIELLSKLVKPFALAVRLFGNLTAGHFVVLSLIGLILFFGAWTIGAVTGVLIAAILLLETLVAILQAYVFALLAATFIGLMRTAH